MVDSQARGLGGQRRVDASRHDGEVEDAVDVVVLRHGVGDGGAVGAASDDHAELDVEGEALLEHARHAAELGATPPRRRRDRRPAADPCRRSRGGRS